MKKTVMTKEAKREKRREIPPKKMGKYNGLEVMVDMFPRA